MFWSTPKILIIVLKRFNNIGEKINKLIDFPLTNLNLNKYCIGYQRKTNIYNLFGVCNHIGDLDSGHYYSYCLKNKDWLNYNDESVTLIDKSNIITRNCYCLFYRKIIQ